MSCLRSRLFCTVILGICFVVVGCASDNKRAQDEAPTPIAVREGRQKPAPQQPRPSESKLAGFVNSGPATQLPLNLLVLGFDASRKRTDVMLAVTIPSKGPINVVSIPRDTRVPTSGKGYRKINEVYAHGGAIATASAARLLLGRSFGRYITLDFTGLQKLVDTLGGVPMDVERAMRYTDRAGGLYIDIKQGRQTLMGSKAIQYIRYRSDGQGDIGRIKRQQKFLSAWAKTIKEQPSRLLALRNGLPTGVSSNFNLAEALRLAANLAMTRRELVFSMLPGRAAYVEKISYWIPGQSPVPTGQPVKAR